jgi:hypothetical protein
MTDAYVDFCAVNDQQVKLYLAVGQGEKGWSSTRMVLMGAEGRLGHHDVNACMVSVDAHPLEFQLAAIGKSGDVSLATRQGVVFEHIDGFGTGKGHFGYATRIRFVGNQLYACGDMRQVYRREVDGWVRFDEGLRVEDHRMIGCALNDIAGTDEGHLFAVGDRGKVFRRQNDQWLDCDAPTNVSIERVLLDEHAVVWASGASGMLIKGDGTQWTVIDSDADADETFWGLARMGGSTYVCSSSGVYREADGRLERLPPLPEGVLPHRLAASLDRLWVLSAATLLCFDGQAWQAAQT